MVPAPLAGGPTERRGYKGLLCVGGALLQRTAPLGVMDQQTRLPDSTQTSHGSQLLSHEVPHQGLVGTSHSLQDRNQASDSSSRGADIGLRYFAH